MRTLVAGLGPACASTGLLDTASIIAPRTAMKERM
jgi:hypothetical protein